jgi:hypothetical protein
MAIWQEIAFRPEMVFLPEMFFPPERLKIIKLRNSCKVLDWLVMVMFSAYFQIFHIYFFLILGAQQSLQEVFHKGMTLKEAIKHAMTILKQVMEEKLSEANVEVATVTKENGYQSLGDVDLQTYIKDLS